MKINLSGTATSTETSLPEGMTEWGKGDLRIYKTMSSTRQGRFHLTALDEATGEYPICTCEGYQYRGKCKHGDAVHKKYWDEYGVSVDCDKDIDGSDINYDT